MSPQQLLVDGQVKEALAELMQQVRRDASNPKLRIFLFQVLCVAGQWKRAGEQLELVGQMDKDALSMVQTYREALRCEAERAQVFAGKHKALILGEPDAWMAFLSEALQCDATGRADDAQRLRARAFEEAPAIAGKLDGRPFAWMADSDSRLGPVLEAVVQGRYYWIPFVRLRRIVLEPPADLRDKVWMPGHIELSTGAEMVALIPTRYVGSEGSDEGGVLLARKTLWTPLGGDQYRGLGQRTFVTDTEEVALMDMRHVEFEAGDGKP